MNERTITLPEIFIFKTGSGETQQVVQFPSDRIDDAAVLTMLAYGVARLLNDTRNGAKKAEWSSLSGEKLVETFLDWLPTRGQRASAPAVPPSLVQAIREYLGAKRKLAPWKAAEKARFDKVPQPKDLAGLREYLAKLNGLDRFPDDKWAGIERAIIAAAAVIAQQRQALSEGGADELLG